MHCENVLMKTYNSINYNLFDGRLPASQFLVRDFSRTKKGWSVVKEDGMYNICIFEEELLEDLNIVYMNLIHQCIHIFHMENGISDTSREGRYHNKKFKQAAESLGLIIEYSKESGHDTVDILEETIEKIAIPNLRRTLNEAIDKDLESTMRTKKVIEGKVRYYCPKCKRTAVAASTTKLICGHCNMEMV